MVFLILIFIVFVFKYLHFCVVSKWISLFFNCADNLIKIKASCGIYVLCMNTVTAVITTVTSTVV